MPRFLFPGSVLLLAACTAMAPLGAQEPGKEPPIKQPSLIELAKLYKDLALPLPPKDTLFAIAVSGYPPLREIPQATELNYHFQFASGGPYPQAKFQVWAGFAQYPRKNLFVIFNRPPQPETVLRYLKMGQLPGWGTRAEHCYSELVFALQCHLLQHFELAKFFYARHLKQANENLHRSLVGLAWNYWAEELTNPKRDRAAIARKLHLLVEKHGFFEALNVQELPLHQELLDRLDLTVKPADAKPGSIDATIDRLVDDPATVPYWNPWLDVDEPDGEETPKDEQQKSPNQREREMPTVANILRNLGFAAIPDLIEHCDDQRLILGPLPPFQHFYAQGEPNRLITIHSQDFRSVGSSARKILSTFFDLDPQTSTKVDYLKSWQQIKVMTEADFVAKKIQNVQDLNQDFTEFMCAKYKKQAIKVYEIMLLKQVDFQHSDLLLDSIVESDLPKPAKVDLLTRCARSEHARQVYEALKRLSKLDNPTFSRALPELLEKMAWKGDGESDDWYRVRIVALAFHTEDRKAKAAVEKYVKSLKANQGLAVLKELGSAETPGSHAGNALSFLCQFLDDETEYQDPKREKAGFKNLDDRLSEVEVRNFAAMQILKHMGIDIPVNDKTSGDEWNKIREFAKDEADRRLENKKKQ